MSSTQHKEYINKIDALITALNKINTTTQNSTQANANIATDLPIDKLDLETQQQFQMFQINYMNKQIQNAKDILLDAVLSMKLLKTDGIMLFNNYLWEKLEPHIYSPKPAIDAILNIYKNEIVVLFIGYQVIIKKTNIK